LAPQREWFVELCSELVPSNNLSYRVPNRRGGEAVRWACVLTVTDNIVAREKIVRERALAIAAEIGF
jgi:hypothetical protein